MFSFDYLKCRNYDEIFKENYENRLYESILYLKKKLKELNLKENDLYLLDNLIQELKELILE